MTEEKKVWTLPQIIEQLKFCGYECEGGPLHLNTAFQALEKMATEPSLGNYDPNQRWGTHTLKITLQIWKYRGHVFMEMGGNCHGLTNILPTDVMEYLENPVTSDCDFEIIEGVEEDGFRCTLTDPATGDTCDVEDALSDLNDMIVGIEIIDFKPKERE